MIGLVSLPRRLTSRPQYSTFVLMEVETLGVARSLGWLVHCGASTAIANIRGQCGSASIASSLFAIGTVTGSTLPRRLPVERGLAVKRWRKISNYNRSLENY